MMINSCYLYNLLQDQARTKLVVDLRPIHEYENHAIRNALHLEFPNHTSEIGSSSISGTRLMWEENPVDCKFKQSKDWIYRGTMFKYVCLYDDGSGTMTSRISELLQIEGKVSRENIFILEGGFDSFKNRYPFMCTSKLYKERAFEGSLPTEVVPGFLYLGGYQNASDKVTLQLLGITHILNMASELENLFPNEFKYQHCGINDTISDNITDVLNQIITFIDSAKDSNGKVLVHCAMGISRSSAAVISWLMKNNNWKFEIAKEYVHKLRSTINPNSGFVKQLIFFENALNSN